MYVWIYVWALDRISLLCVSVFVTVPCCFHYSVVMYSFKSGGGLHPALFFLLSIALAFWSLLWFRTRLGVIVSISVKNALQFRYCTECIDAFV